MVAAARRIARREKCSLYLVGGPVRDLYLGRPLCDVDVVVESDALVFARRLSETLGVPARVHERFGTATLEMPGGGHLDVARSRRETYERPGALPRVEPAPIEEDLGRRDFTINAMALELAPGARVLDPFEGKADLEKGVVRMLHAGSPQDDPTRAFRAVRYANRLGFRIEAKTRRWIAEASRRGVFDAVSGDRLRRELRLLFSEANRARAVRLLCRLGLDREIDPALPREASVFGRLRRAERIAGRHPGKTSWLLSLLTWSAGLDSADLERLSRRLSLAGGEARSLRAWPDVLRALRSEGRRASPSAILARGVSANEIAAAAAALTGSAAGRLERALCALETRLAIAGRDLVAAGVPAGPSIGRALEATLSARRDRQISRRQELGYALAAARPPAGGSLS
jgi:tRNA nucleotidyltransferase (CCA-adding enzyme)